MENESYKFLKLFRQEEKEIVLTLGHENPSVENKTQRTMFHLPINIDRLNKPVNQWAIPGYNTTFFINTNNIKFGKGVFFVVNPGGQRNEQIKKAAAYFIDKDFAKIEIVFEEEEKANIEAKSMEDSNEFETIQVQYQDHSKKYVLKARRKIRVIQEYKKRFLEEYSQDFIGSLIVETYSGFHIYWVLEKLVCIDDFYRVQKALVKRFDSDHHCVNPSRLMRVPGFIHQKYEKHMEVKVFQWPSKMWSKEELIKCLDLTLISEQEKGFNKEDKAGKNMPIIVSKPESGLVFKKWRESKENKQMTFNETVQWIVRQPLETFVESPDMTQKKFCCPFHNDQHPSATIFTSTYGEEVFYCHACTVGARNIVGLYMAHYGKNYRQSVEALAEMVRIKIVETDFERNQFRKHRENRIYLNEEHETFYPYTSKYIDKFGRKAFLRYFNDKAESHVFKEQYQYKGESVFFLSYRAIARELGKKSMRTVQNTVNLLKMLGFIERVPDEYIPSELKERAELEKKLMQKELRQQGEEGEKRADAINLISFYIVTNWSNNAFEIEETARLMCEKRFTFKNNSNKIGLEKMFGKQTANRIFPDGRTVPRRFEKIKYKLWNYIKLDLEKQGFAILEKVVTKQVKVGKEAIKLHEKKSVLKRALPELLKEDFEVRRVRSEEKKKQYGFNKKNPCTIQIFIKKGQ